MFMESLSTRWHQIVETFRWQGVFGLFFKVLGLFGYRRAFIIEKALHARSHQGLLWRGEIRRLDPDEIELYLAFRNRDAPARVPPERIKKNFEKGRHCFAAFSDGKIIAASWVAEEDCWSSFLQQSIVVSPGETYVFDSFCSPEFRGQGIVPAIGERITDYFSERGYSYSIRAVEPENRPSLRACLKLGYRIRSLVGTVRLGPLKWTFSKSTWRGKNLNEQNRTFFLE